MLSILKSGEENKLEVFVAMRHCIVTRLFLLITDRNRFVIDAFYGVAMLFILKLYDLFSFFYKEDVCLFVSVLVWNWPDFFVVDLLEEKDYFIILRLEWMCTYIVYLLNADFKYWNLEISYNLLKWLNLNISTKVDTFFYINFSINWI